MELEEMRALWARQDEKLDRCIELNERVLRETRLGKAKTALSRQVVYTALHLALGAPAIVLLGAFILSRIAEPRFVISAAAIDVFAIAMVGSMVWQLTLISRIDYGGSVTAMQRAIEKIKLIEYRTFKWALLSGFVLWFLVPIVAFEALFDVDLFAHVPVAWVFSNLALAAVVVVAGLWWSKKYVEHSGARPWAKRLVDGVAGNRLKAVAGFLDELSEFEREEPR